MSRLLLEKGTEPEDFGRLLDGLPSTEQRKVLFSVLKLLSADYLDRLGLCESIESSTPISAVAGSISSIIRGAQARRTHLAEWLTSSSGAGLGEGVGIRRAVLAVVSQDKDAMVEVLERSISQFGDQLYIKHSPILQQEGRCLAREYHPEIETDGLRSTHPSSPSECGTRPQNITFQTCRAHEVKRVA